jgi:hypothetical protein
MGKGPNGVMPREKACTFRVLIITIGNGRRFGVRPFGSLALNLPNMGYLGSLFATFIPSGEKMRKSSPLKTVEGIMNAFAHATGLSPSTEMPRRYLWTDAFAVCNFIELSRRTGDPQYMELALKLVDQVHQTLGRHRKDDNGTGWISGLDEQEGNRHPTKGGLRIGKEMKERGPSEPYDERMEWNRDGQYYHYLTQWMHALNCVTRLTGDQIFNTWAIELAQTAHAAFTHDAPSGGRKRMYWKMNIALSHPLVTSMGQHDPLDGYVTYHQLQATASAHEMRSATVLRSEIADMEKICRRRNWATDDPLGLGSLLCNGYKVAQMIVSGHFEDHYIFKDLLSASLQGLSFLSKTNHFDLPLAFRLPFRELGLTIGLKALKRLQLLLAEKAHFFDRKAPLADLMDLLMESTPLIERIQGDWIEDRNRKIDVWTEHQDINMTMLATSLAPEGYLTL